MPPSIPLTQHTDDDINPFVRQDLENATAVDVDVFLDNLICPRAQRRQWMAEIGQLRWYADRVMQQALSDYCAAKNEKQRYNPFVKMMNRALELAPGNLSGVPKDRPYPLGDLSFANHSHRQVKKIPEHGIYAGRRLPDIVLVSHEVADKIETTKDGRAEWTDILFWCEAKFGITREEDLAEENEDRGLSDPPTPKIIKPINRRTPSVCAVNI